MMIKQTECESKEMPDEFIQAMIDVARQAESDSAPLQSAPAFTPIKRPGELKAAKAIDLSE